MDLIGRKARRRPIKQLLVFTGNSCLAIGVALFLAAVMGFVSPTVFAVGEESGLRVIGAITVFGCMIAAIGYINE